MPIDVSPPMSGNLQGFQITQPQSTDPLQTLAQMGQLRTQGLQQQQAQLGITQAQLQMKSQQAMLQAFVDGGGNPDKTQQIVMTHPDILPSDKIGLQTHMLDLAKQKLALSKDQLDLQDQQNDHWANLLMGAKNQDDVNAAVARGVQSGYKPPAELIDAQGNIQQFTDPMHIQAYANSLLSYSKMDAQKLVQQQNRGGGREGTAESTAAAGEATTEKRDRAAHTKAIAEIQGAADPATGMPALTDYTAIKQRYPPGRSA